MSTAGRVKGDMRYPLDNALGSEAQVKLLRVLLMSMSEPLSVSDLARLAGLTAAGARRALDRLRVAGFVRRVGSGHTPTYQVRSDAAGIQALGFAFEEEQARYDRFLAALTRAVSIPELTAAWIDDLSVGPVDPLHVSVVAEVHSVSWIQSELRARLVVIEQEFDLIIEVEVHTRADSPTPAPEAMMLWGIEPETKCAQRPPTKTHDRAIQRELQMSRKIGDMIRRDPNLIDRAKRHVARYLKDDQGMARSDLFEWSQLLESYSPDRLADLLGSTSSRAERLRQSSPFFAVLTSQERGMVLEAIEVSS